MQAEGRSFGRYSSTAEKKTEKTQEEWSLLTPNLWYRLRLLKLHSFFFCTSRVSGVKPSTRAWSSKSFTSLILSAVPGSMNDEITCFATAVSRQTALKTKDTHGHKFTIAWHLPKIGERRQSKQAIQQPFYRTRPFS